MAVKLGSLDADAHGVCRLSVNSQYNINFAAAGQRARDADVGLVKPDKTALRSGKSHFGARSANCRGHRRQSAAESESAAKQHQKDLIIRRAQINRNGNELILS